MTVKVPDTIKTLVLSHEEDTEQPRRTMS